MKRQTHEGHKEANNEANKELNKARVRKRARAPKLGLVDCVCLVVRVVGALLWVLLYTSFIYVLVPLRPFNFVWRKMGIITNFPLDMATKLWAVGVFRVLGGTAIVETSKKIAANTPTIMMYSHGSFYDPLIMGGYAPITAKYVFKKELFFLFPFIFVAAWIVGHIPINRVKRSSAISALQGAARAVKDNKRSVVLAPEGTRTTDGNLQPFKKGPFHLAFDAGVKYVVPVVIFNAWELWPPGQLFPRPGTMRIHYLDPVETKNETLESLSNRVHEVMEKEIERVELLKLHPSSTPPPLRNIGPALLVWIFSATLFFYLYCWYFSIPFVLC